MIENDKKKTDTKLKPIKATITNSIQPSIKECERFIVFLNKRFKLGLPDNLIVNITETKSTIKGYFMSKEHSKGYVNTQKPLNYICISSHHLKDNPYETVAHELAHFYNYANGINDCTVNQYHNKHFKIIAEKLLLKVDRGTRGFAYTDTTKEFNEMLKEFKPNKKAFHIFQKMKDKGKSPNRNLLFICDCGIKVRTARNIDKPFNAICQYCNTEFRQTN